MTKLLGVCADVGLQQYALYQPVLARLVLTTASLTQAQSIELLSSARYHLHVCDLTTASNFHANLVDNTCCLFWDISDDSVMSAAEPVKVGRLIHAGPAHIDFQHEHQWLQSCQYWLTFMDYVKQQIYPDYARIEFTREMWHHAQDDQFHDITQADMALRRCLYRCHQDSTVEIVAMFKQHLRDFEKIHSEFDQWQR